ncbi:MAG TPA: glycosyltransferase family 4 protein [Tepidisphaeraceae bacterium]|jgi:glycosyltransferase involved in cell wall biosynthesis
MASEITLWTICTHETTGDRWEFVAPPEINPISFGKGHTVLRQNSPKFALSEFQKGGKIIDWLINNRVSAVIMLGYNDPARLRIIRWCAANDVPLFLWGDSNIYGDTVTGFKAWLKERVVGRIISSCTGALPCGTCGRAFFARYGAKEDRMFYFPVEPDYDLVTGLSPEFIEKVRQDFNISTERRRFIFSARITQVKRPDLMVDAFVRIAARRPNWDLLMLGEGELRQELMARVPEHLKDRIIWTGFLDDQAVISALYRLSDALVLPSDFEPWGLVINEAAAAGIAIISSTVVGASNELVRDGVNGRIFPTGDLSALEEAMLDISEGNRIDTLKANSPKILDRWRKRGDPIEGLRKALRFCKVI